MSSEAYGGPATVMVSLLDSILPSGVPMAPSSLQSVVILTVIWMALLVLGRMVMVHRWSRS